jgi:hypothetical protein
VKGKHEIRLENLTKKGVKAIKRDVVVFTFFLFLSFVFWYLNSLGKEIEAGFWFPVKYVNLPKERLIIEKPSERLNIYVKGPGYSILKLKVSGSGKPVSIDISKVSYNRVHGSKAFNYYIVTSGLAKSLSVQLRSEFEITSIKPDTLFFALEKVVLKPELENKQSRE